MPASRGIFMIKIKAFTLVELMVAASITGIAVFSLLASYIACISLTEMTSNITIATEDGRRVIEQMRSMGATSLSSIISTDWTTWAANNGCNNLAQEQILVVYQDRDGTGDPLDDDPLDVTVNVTWQERGRARIIDFYTLITPL